jgi:hypothetical protein
MFRNGETTSTNVGTIFGASVGRRKYVFNLNNEFLYNSAFSFSWNGPATIYQIELLWRPDEEEIVNWSFPPTSHGLSGWQQMRDIYLTTANSGALVLTVNSDSQQDSYDVPSTSGLKRKQHVKLRARKGKLFSYSLVPAQTQDGGDGPSFRVYGEDCEARVKVWNTNLGYDLISVFKNPGA